MAVFPTLSIGAVAMYPVTEIISTRTQVVQFGDRSEQRWVKRRPLRRFTLVYTGLPLVDRNALKTFWLSCKGKYDTFDFVWRGVTYLRMSFDDDSYTETEQVGRVFEVRLSLVQHT
jgi:hypothetical protein